MITLRKDALIISSLIELIMYIIGLYLVGTVYGPGIVGLILVATPVVSAFSRFCSSHYIKINWV